MSSFEYTRIFILYLLFIFVSLRGEPRRSGLWDHARRSEAGQCRPGTPSHPTPSHSPSLSIDCFEMVCIDGRVHFKFQPFVNVTIPFHVASTRPVALQREREREIYRRPSGEREVLVQGEGMDGCARACTREGAVFVHVCDACVRAYRLLLHELNGITAPR